VRWAYGVMFVKLRALIDAIGTILLFAKNAAGSTDRRFGVSRRVTIFVRSVGTNRSYHFQSFTRLRVCSDFHSFTSLRIRPGSPFAP
jgi:hypothetical protein